MWLRPEILFQDHMRLICGACVIASSLDRFRRVTEKLCCKLPQAKLFYGLLHVVEGLSHSIASSRFTSLGDHWNRATFQTGIHLRTQLLSVEPARTSSFLTWWATLRQ